MVKMVYSDREKYDTRHGGAFDRGSADSYYNRPLEPHMYEGATLNSRLIRYNEMTNEQVAEYNAGYWWNEQCGDKKSWV